MNSLAIKGFAGLAASAAIAGTTVISIKSSSHKKETKPIKTLLGKNKPEKKLLFKDYQGVKGGSPAEWKNVWRQYRTDYQNEESNPFNLTLVKSSSIQDENAPDNFMEACASLFEEKVDGVSSNRYQLADKYCTRLTSVADLVWEEKKKVLADDNNGQSQQWKELWRDYRKDNQGKSAKQNEWGLGGPWNDVDSLEAASAEFRKKCGEESQVKTGYKNNPSFLNILKYCSVPQ